MKFRFPAGTAGLMFIALATAAVARAETDLPTQVPDYYVGAGLRGLKGDVVAAVLGSKIKLTRFGEHTFSTRPALLFGGYDTEASLPFTIDGRTNSYGFAWFGGAGVAYNMDDHGEIDAMVTGGIDVPFENRLVLSVQINYLYQHAISDVDGELLVTLNRGF